MRIVIYRRDSVRSTRRALELLPEGKSYDFGQKWGARTDPPHHTKMLKHTHITHGGHDVWVVNADGTDSHGTTRDGVPGWVVDELRAKRIIEEIRRILRSKSKRVSSKRARSLHSPTLRHFHQLHRSGQIAIEPAAPTAPTSRDFLPWRFSDASRRIAWMRPHAGVRETCTGPDFACLEQGHDCDEGKMVRPEKGSYSEGNASDVRRR